MGIKKSAIITGITGQDGSYLARLLLKKKIKVYGIVRRTSSDPMIRLEELNIKNRINFIYTDLSESFKIGSLIKKIKPNYFFNLGAQSFVTYSYDNPMYTDNINNFSVINILEHIRLFSPKTRFYQASSSEMYGLNLQNVKKYNETSQFNPISPYAISKLSSYYYVRMYRTAYKVFACNGILFNHESPLRGEHFVTKKIIKSLVEIYSGEKKDSLKLGNIYSKRDWGHAEEYVNMMLKIITYKIADDFVISSGKQYTIKDFINLTCKRLGIKIKWRGKGLNEKAIGEKGRKIVEISKRLFRPQDVKYLLGDSTKAKRKLKWKPKKNLNTLIDEMINFELGNFNANN